MSGAAGNTCSGVPIGQAKPTGTQEKHRSAKRIGGAAKTLEGFESAAKSFTSIVKRGKRTIFQVSKVLEREGLL